MRLERIVASAWVVGLVVVSVVGAGIPPSTGVGLPDDQGPSGGAALEDSLGGVTPSLDRLSVSLSPAVHDPDRTLVVAAPERAPFPGEARAVDRFLADGGRVVLFLATTAWNDVLSNYGVRLHGALLLSARGGENPSSIPVDMPASMGGGSWVLANATALVDPGPNLTTVEPAREMVLDLDGDGEISLDRDTAGRFPVAARTPVGEGTLVVVASGEAVLGGTVTRNLDGLERLLSDVAGNKPGVLDTSTHPMGFADAVRGPARAVASPVHASPWAAGVGLALLGLAVYLVPGVTRRRDAEGSRLDEMTEATQEWLHREAP